MHSSPPLHPVPLLLSKAYHCLYFLGSSCGNERPGCPCISDQITCFHLKPQNFIICSLHHSTGKTDIAQTSIIFYVSRIGCCTLFEKSIQVLLCGNTRFL